MIPAVRVSAGQGGHIPGLEDAAGVRAPVDLTAFCQHRQHRYLAYARLRTGDTSIGKRIVRAAFAHLSDEWMRILGGANPAADAWRVLGTEIEAARPQFVSEGTGAAIYEVLPVREADAISLHYLLGMTLTSAADLMGSEASAVAAHLLTAERVLPTDLMRALEQRTPIGG